MTRFLLLTITLLLLSGYSHAQCDTAFVANVTQVGGTEGAFHAIETDQSVEEFYNRGFRSYRGAVPTMPNTAMLMLHRDTTTCQYSFVLVLDSMDSKSWGTADFVFSGDWSNPVVKDDGFDIFRFRNGETVVLWGWFRGGTDGLAQHIVEYECFTVRRRDSRRIDAMVWITPNMTTDDNSTEYVASPMNMVNEMEICLDSFYEAPSAAPSAVPSAVPTLAPEPSAVPSAAPSVAPSPVEGFPPTRAPVTADYCDSNPCKIWQVACNLEWQLRCNIF